jgi:uncharacterized membrane protein (DUF4010 family)
MYSELSPFLTAIVIGLLIGIERERSKNKKGTVSILGARTLPMIGLLGAIMAAVANIGIQLIISTFVCIVILVSEVRWKKNSRHISIRSTSSIAAILIFVLGYLAFINAQLAIILAVLLFGILAVKSSLHDFARTGITKKEMSASLTFLLSAFVILPLLPNEFIDPWGLVQPTRIWLLFVLIAGVQFFSYIALRFIGNKWGTLLTGLLGGFVSATAATLSLALKVKDQPQTANMITGGIILAEVSSLIIQLFVVSIIITDISIKLLLLLAIPAFVGVVMALFLTVFSSATYSEGDEAIEVKVANPISLKSTLIFAFLISVGLIIIALAARYLGTNGVYATAVIGGFASLRVVTFSVSELLNSGDMLISVASISILLAMSTNMIVKLIIIKRAGSSKLFLISSVCFMLMLGSGFVFHFWNLLSGYLS